MTLCTPRTTLPDNLFPYTTRFRSDRGAVAGDASGQVGKALWIAGKEVGVVQHPFVGGDRRLKPIDFPRQPVVVALVLVGQFVPRRRPGDRKSTRLNSSH